MLTPAFELSQDASTVTFHIRAPHAKITDTEIYVDGPEFKFYSKPYYLRLNLPGDLLEDGREQAKYEADSGSFVIHIPKACPGSHFEGLDMLTKLLAPVTKQKNTTAPLIEVIGSEDTCTKESEQEEEEEEEEEEFDWQVEQQPYEETSLTEGPMYGFANQRTGVFHRLQSELCGVIDLPWADQTPACERRSLRLATELEDFNEDHYCADLYEEAGGMIPHLLKYQPPWDDEYQAWLAGKPADAAVLLTESEREKMRMLPRKEYLLDAVASRGVFTSLVDIIYAYAYNHRTTEGENTVESHWTICKLSPTLSWLESPLSAQDAAVSGMRRSLCYPLYRHWKMVEQVLRDTKRIFALGRRRLLKCLLDLHGLLSESDPRYLLNDLYVTDYCVWIQNASEKHLRSLAGELDTIQPSKQDMQLDLLGLELAAEMALEQAESDDDSSDSSDSDALESDDDLVAKVADLKVQDEVLVGEAAAGVEGTLCKVIEDGALDLGCQLPLGRLAAGGPGEGGEQKEQPAQNSQDKDQSAGGDQPAANGANGARAKKQAAKDPSGQGRKEETSDSSDSDSYTDSDTCSEDEYDIELMEKVTGSVQ